MIDLMNWELFFNIIANGLLILAVIMIVYCVYRLFLSGLYSGGEVDSNEIQAI